MPQIVINVTGPEALRLQAVVTRLQGSPASAEDVRQYVIKRLKRLVLQTEQEAYIAAHAPQPFDPT